MEMQLQYMLLFQKGMSTLGRETNTGTIILFMWFIWISVNAEL